MKLMTIMTRLSLGPAAQQSGLSGQSVRSHLALEVLLHLSVADAVENEVLLDCFSFFNLMV